MFISPFPYTPSWALYSENKLHLDKRNESQGQIAHTEISQEAETGTELKNSPWET